MEPGSLNCDIEKFNCIYSCHLNHFVEIKIGSLEGTIKKLLCKDLLEDQLTHYISLQSENGIRDLVVICQLYSGGRELCLPISTCYKPFTTRMNWNEWIKLPVRYCDLPRDSILGFTIWDACRNKKSKPIGGTTINLFSKRGAFKQGIHDLKIWSGLVADCINNTTNGKTKAEENQEYNRIFKLKKLHKNGQLPRVDWLDKLAFREIEQINNTEKKESSFLYLNIQFPEAVLNDTTYFIVYYENGVDESEILSMKYDSDPGLFDPDINEIENLVETKHHFLFRGNKNIAAEMTLKPNADDKNKLQKIIEYPISQNLTHEEKDMVWKFRYYLSSQKKALTKFLKTVNMSSKSESICALKMIDIWNPIDPEDALELLGKDWQQPEIRMYAVKRLKEAPNDDLILYLLQLVQALKYENPQIIVNAFREDEKRYKITNAKSEQDLESSFNDNFTIGAQKANDLATFLIYRARESTTLANYFYWYLKAEASEEMAVTNQKVGIIKTNIYQQMILWFLLVFNVNDNEIKKRKNILLEQEEFINALTVILDEISKISPDKKKIEKLISKFKETDDVKFNFQNFGPLPLSIDPNITVNSLSADETEFFKSKLMPWRLTFKTVDGKKYVMIFKHGDDLRQDQLVLQMITLMDRILRKENLDLKLTPYKVLAISNKLGFVEFVHSKAISAMSKPENGGSILNYLRKVAGDEKENNGIKASVMENYFRSLAGYSVITYLLGVGDRHLDNIMLQNDGKLFHIDFGFILGREPKPLMPPINLCKEICQDVIGGKDSEYFVAFKQHAYTAYLSLRRSANVILNLFALMLDANIPDIALEPDKTLKKVQERFHLELNDEQAVEELKKIIEESLAAKFIALHEYFHKLRVNQY